MADITIRQSVEGDAAIILKFLAALAEEIGDAGRFAMTEASIRRHGFGADRRFWSTLALRGQEPLGLAVFFPIFSTTRGAPGVYVQDLYVAPEARGLGLGQVLLQSAVREARTSWGAVYLTLLVYDANHAARRFYRRVGCHLPDDERPAFLDGPAFAALGDAA